MICPNCRCFVPQSLNYCGYCGCQMPEGDEQTLPAVHSARCTSSSYAPYDTSFAPTPQYRHEAYVPYSEAPNAKGTDHYRDMFDFALLLLAGFSTVLLMLLLALLVLLI